MAEVDDSLECVQIDGLALLRIVKHCKENSPDPVTGTLLGLDVNRRLEITNAFPMPGMDGSDAANAYQESMLKNLRSVNVDNNNVGWYISSYMGSFYDQEFLDNQFSHQKVSPTSVVLVLDPLRTSSGRLALKAFRLSKVYMEAYAQKKHRDVKWNQGDVLEEVPIKVHNPHLVHGFLYDIRENKSMSCDADRLALAAPSVIERNLDFLMRAMDDYGQDQGKWQFYQRALARQKAQQAAYIAKFKSENDARLAAGKDPLPEEDYSKHPLWKPISTPKPSRLDSLLLSKQMQHQCSVVNATATASFDKLYVIDALQKPK